MEDLPQSPAGSSGADTERKPDFSGEWVNISTEVRTARPLHARGVCKEHCTITLHCTEPCCSPFTHRTIAFIQRRP
jgi:hypothetical protein